ncbi:MAG: hypothetical protein MUF18_04780 [Fimbriiglobus sp.]|jgi:hypothetical protein|nr:hypothetical protein [Fimbriiglobus sp.]
MTRFLACLLAFALPAAAQDKGSEEAVKKQKATAAENLAKIKIPKPTLIETDHLLVYADLPAEKLKPIADAAQKARERAFKDLKFTDKDRLPDGKLTLYVLADRTKEYTPFVKVIEQRTGKLDADEMQTTSLKGYPYAAVTTSPATKSTDADLKAEAMAAVVTLLIDQKAGGPVPTWIHVGMGKAIAYRTEGNTKLLEAHKAKTRPLFTRAKVGLFKAADVWGEKRFTEIDTLTVSLAEYLLYGADGETMGKFLGGFRETEERRNPGINTALEAAGWKLEELDAAWKKWAMSGK